MSIESNANLLSSITTIDNESQSYSSINVSLFERISLVYSFKSTEGVQQERIGERERERKREREESESFQVSCFFFFVELFHFVFNINNLLTTLPYHKTNRKEQEKSLSLHHIHIHTLANNFHLVSFLFFVFKININKSHSE